ncbi:MAG: SoxR reducing system RseC family protein [bacterium]|nr:MAG: SoxR reducing system RseC family protein [bacterium]
MEKEMGQVIRIEEEKADILLHSGEVCSHCSVLFSCTTAASADRIMTFENSLNARLDDRVEIELSEKTRIYSALLIFFMPSLFIIA